MPSRRWYQNPKLAAPVLIALTAFSRALVPIPALGAGTALGPSTHAAPDLLSSRARLPAQEGEILDLLTVLRQPLTAEEMCEIESGRKPPLWPEPLRKGANRLVRERWLESSRDGRTKQKRFRLAEGLRPKLERWLLDLPGRRIELHRRAFAWYQKEFPVAAMDPQTIPSPERVAGYDELLHQAFCVAELTEGEEKQTAVLVAGRVARDSWNWHMQPQDNPLLRARFVRAKPLLEGQSSPAGRDLYAHLLRLLGDLYVRRDHLDRAERQLGAALPMFRTVEDREGEAATLQSLGALYVRRERLVEAVGRYKEALPVYRTIQDRGGEARTQKALGDLCARTDRLGEAEERYESALSVYRAIEDRLGEADTLRSTGDLYVQADRLDKAKAGYEQALPVYRAIASRLGEAQTLSSLGDLYVRTGRPAEAETQYKAALPGYRAIGNRQGEAYTLRSLGDLYARANRLADAKTRYEAALPLFRSIDPVQVEMSQADFWDWDGPEVGVPRPEVEDSDGSTIQYVGLASRPWAREGVVRLNVAYALQALGDLEVRTGRLAEAEARYQEALPLFRRAKSGLYGSVKHHGGLFVRTDPPTGPEVRLAEFLTLMSLRDLYVRTGRQGEAEQRYEEALHYFRTMVRETLLDTSTGFRSGSLDRLMELRGRLGGETFDAIIQKIFELFPPEDRETWVQVREKMQAAHRERDNEP